jgi:hypothetical protein
MHVTRKLKFKDMEFDVKKRLVSFESVLKMTKNIVVILLIGGGLP